MRFRYPIIAFLALAIIASLFFRRHSEESSPNEPVVSAATPPKTAVPTAKASPPAIKAKAGPQKPEQAAEEGNRVFFRVVNGLAIAYGDVLLGTPENPELTEGYYEAPVPQAWDRPEIAYLIHADLPRPERVEQAIQYFHDHTPVTFVPYDGQPDALVFEPGNEHCLSYLGRLGGKQPIRLEANCSSAEIIHEIMHALGFVHEQSRSDRDEHVEVLWNNIEEKYRDQYALVPEALTAAIKDTPFDYRSVMLYRPDIFAASKGAVTMRSRTGATIDPVRFGLSPGDIARLNRLYPK